MEYALWVHDNITLDMLNERLEDGWKVKKMKHLPNQHAMLVILKIDIDEFEKLSDVSRAQLKQVHEGTLS